MKHFHFSNLGQACLSLVFCLALSSCNKDEFYEKEYLENPDGTTTEGSDNGGGQAGSSSTGSTQGGVSGGVDGGTSGGTTTGSSTGGTTTGGTTTGGTTTGGTTTGGTTTGGTTTGGTTTGGTTTGGATTGGTSGGVSVTENFSQSAAQTKKLDILWIVDNSGSMANEQADLGEYFEDFITNFITRNVDFKMGVTTTDTSTSSRRGKMVTGSDTLLTSAKAQSNEAQFLIDFKNLVNVGITGSGYERGLNASEWFMVNNPAWIRSDAYLAVVIISDEEDQSPKTPTQYTDYLKSLKSSAGLVKVYSIVDKTLSNNVGNVSTGFQRYADASNNTAGTVSDIGENFSTVLAEMGNEIINLLDSFALAHDPISGTLKVYVNDVETTNYSFDASSRSIKFASGNLPPVGATVKVTYQK